jgi:hypothetical protein
MGETNIKLEKIQEGLCYLADLNLLDAFYDKIWCSEDTHRLLDKYKDKSEYYDLPIEETDKVRQHVIEWFGENYGLAEMDCKYWMFSVGSIEEGGHKWWYRIKLNTDDLETARKIILLDKLMVESQKYITEA